MSFTWFVVGVMLMGVGLAGLLLPLLPGMPLIFLGALAIAAADGFTRVGYLSLVLMAVLAVVGSVLDHVAGSARAQSVAAPRAGEWPGRVVGLSVGLPFGLPGLVSARRFGSAAFEFARDQELRRAARASTGVLVGFVLGTVVKSRSPPSCSGFCCSPIRSDALCGMAAGRARRRGASKVQHSDSGADARRASSGPPDERTRLHQHPGTWIERDRRGRCRRAHPEPAERRRDPHVTRAPGRPVARCNMNGRVIASVCV